jgi:hypothetical protein
MDVQNWSGLTRLREVVDGLRPRLVAFRAEDGRELLDLPEAPRPDPGVPAPVRLLGEFDNLLLGHADRSRMIPADFPWGAMLAHSRSVNTVLVDGTLRGTWWVERAGKGPATLGLRPWPGSTRPSATAVAEEAGRILRFLAPDAPAHDVRFEPAPG